MDYLLLIIGLLGSFFGIAGDTWDNSKTGINKLTKTGKIIATIIVATFIFSIFQIRKRNKQLSVINEIANTQIRLALKDILSPLGSGTITLDQANFFETIKDTNYLSKIFKKEVLNILYNGQTGNTFGHPYRQDSLNIQEGENLLNDAILKYNTYLDEQTIKNINETLSDNFYKTNYKFKQNHLFIEEALFFFNNKSNPNWTNPPYNTYEPYYSTADIKGNNKYNGLTSFIAKVEVLYNHIKE
ncbi:MAG: hypothetical protein QM731_08595 [Chitinophagaceae bacterium]